MKSMNNLNPAHRLRQSRSSHTVIGKAAGIIMIAGSLILILSIVYMIVNIGTADSIVKTWIVFMIAGIAATAAGIILKSYVAIKRDFKGYGKPAIGLSRAYRGNSPYRQ